MFQDNDKSCDLLLTQTGVAFSASERLALLNDIARIGLLLGKSLTESVLPLTKGEKRANRVIVAPLEQMRRLAEQWRTARTLLPDATARQDTALTEIAATLPAAQSRGGRKAANEIARRPQSRAAWLAAASEKGAAAAGRSRISEARPLSVTDTPANRFVVTLLENWRDRARTLAALAEFCAEAELAAEMERIAKQAEQWRQRPEWRGLRPLNAAQSFGAALSVPRWPAAHRALAEQGRMTDRALRFDWKNSLRTDWPELEAWRLYEIWCYLKIAETLSGAGWKAQKKNSGGAGGSAVRVSTQGISLQLEKGRKSELLFARDSKELTLTYQTLFPSAAQSLNFAAARCVSRTHAMQPDICLEFGGRLYLLDPKFRAYETTQGSENAHFARADSAMQEDINKMHAYRDAIVCDEKNVVAAAWCLFPGGPNNERSQVIAFPPAVPENPFGAAGIGAICLRPGRSTENLALLLELWFKAAP